MHWRHGWRTAAWSGRRQQRPVDSELNRGVISQQRKRHREKMGEREGGRIGGFSMNSRIMCCQCLISAWSENRWWGQRWVNLTTIYHEAQPVCFCFLNLVCLCVSFYVFPKHIKRPLNIIQVTKPGLQCWGCWIKMQHVMHENIVSVQLTKLEQM